MFNGEVFRRPLLLFDRDDRGSTSSEPTPDLRRSWIFEGVDEDIVSKLLSNQAFVRYVGLPLRLTRSKPTTGITSELLESHVGANLTGVDFGFNLAMWRKHQAGDLIAEPFSFFPKEEHLGAEIKLYALLLVDLLNERGFGCDIETLAQKFIRPRSFGLWENVPYGALVLYIRDPNGKIYQVPDKSPYIFKEKGRKWEVDQWLRDLEATFGDNQDDIDFIRQEIETGRQPFVSLRFDVDRDTPLDARPDWGVQLRALSPYEIRKLAEHGLYCEPSCHCYHGYVDRYKELNQLIAPVDAQVLGERLVEKYTEWLGRNSADGKFRVLIPAQADETTLTGLLDYLDQHGVSYRDVKNHFSFVLADLCVTPLLRVFAAPKERDLLKIANVVSMDVFKWAEDLEKFEFIAADHFVDLFPAEGKNSQLEVIRTLAGSLAPHGELVLTARCGTVETIDEQEIMTGFRQRVDKEIQRALNHLDNRDTVTSSGAQEMLQDKLAVARTIYALLVYRQLRQVYPFPNVAYLQELLNRVSEETVDGIKSDIKSLPENKVRIAISRDG